MGVSLQQMPMVKALLNGKGTMLESLGGEITCLPELVALLINLFLFAILIQVILSWVSPGGYNPVTGLIHSLTDPLLRPARRLIPPISGLDLSPMLVMVLLILLKMLLLPPLQILTGSPFR